MNKYETIIPMTRPWPGDMSDVFPFLISEKFPVYSPSKKLSNFYDWLFRMHTGQNPGYVSSGNTKSGKGPGIKKTADHIV